MADTKSRRPQTAQPDSEPKGDRRRLSRIVHDHKGTATVQWYDAPPDCDRPLLEIEGARAPSAQASDDPYMRIPEAERKRSSSQRTDLRKLSAWIKMMRSLEEAKKHRDDDDE